MKAELLALLTLTLLLWVLPCSILLFSGLAAMVRISDYGKQRILYHWRVEKSYGEIESCFTGEGHRATKVEFCSFSAEEETLWYNITPIHHTFQGSLKVNVFPGMHKQLVLHLHHAVHVFITPIALLLLTPVHIVAYAHIRTCIRICTYTCRCLLFYLTYRTLYMIHTYKFNGTFQSIAI